MGEIYDFPGEKRGKSGFVEQKKKSLYAHLSQIYNPKRPLTVDGNGERESISKTYSTKTKFMASRRGGPSI